MTNPETLISGPESHADASADATPTNPIGDDDGRTFDSEYVRGLREEAKSNRLSAKAAEEKADAYARQLHTEYVRSLGRLANPEELAYDPEHLESPEKLNAAIDDLIARKPYMANRIPVPGSNIGQGQQGSPVAPPPSLIDAIRAKQGR